jgi:hypothetical protein
MDIIKIDIERARTGEAELVLDSQISGGPNAGTSETILVRPVGTNFNASVITEGYKITVAYTKASHPEQITETELSSLDLSDGTLEILFGSKLGGPSLPRGKQILHIYRNKTSGNLEISTDDPETNNNDYFDYIQNVNIKNSFDKISIEDLDITIDVSKIPQVAIDFSPEVKNIISELKIPLEDLTQVLENMNTNVASIGNVLIALKDIFSEFHIKNGKILDTNEGYLYIHNLTGLSVSNIKIGTLQETIINAGAEKGGVLKIGNYEVLVEDTNVTSVYINHQIPHDLYFYLTVGGDYKWTTVWPPVNGVPAPDEVKATIEVKNQTTGAEILETRIIGSSSYYSNFNKIVPSKSSTFYILSSIGFVIGQHDTFEALLIVKDSNGYYEIKKYLDPDGYLFNQSRTIVLIDADIPDIVPSPPAHPNYFTLKISVIEPSDDTLNMVAVRLANRSVSDGRTGIQYATATDSFTYKTYFTNNIYPPMTSYISLGTIKKGTSTEIILPWEGSHNGYDLFFIEGDGRVRGYSLSGKTAPPKADNYIFFIEMGTREVTYATKSNYSNIILGP